MRNKYKKLHWNEEAREFIFKTIKRERCEAAILGMPTETWLYVLDTDASAVAITRILY